MKTKPAPASLTVAMPLSAPRLPTIDHAVGLPPGATLDRFSLPRLSDELEAMAVYWEARRVAAVTIGDGDEASWRLHQIRIKRDAARAART